MANVAEIAEKFIQSTGPQFATEFTAAVGAQLEHSHAELAAKFISSSGSQFASDFIRAVDAQIKHSQQQNGGHPNGGQPGGQQAQVQAVSAITQAGPGEYVMVAPPEAQYPSYQDLFDGVNRFAANHGYALVVRSTSKLEDGKTWRRRLACSRHGSCRKQGKGIRKTNHRRVQCTMGITVSAVDKENPDGPWQVSRKGDHSDRHNHPPEEASNIPLHRRMQRTEQVLAAIRGLEAGVKLSAGKKLELVNQQLGGQSLQNRKDIENEVAKYRQRQARIHFGE